MELVYNNDFISIYYKDGNYYKILHVDSGTAKAGDVFIINKESVLSMVLTEGYLYSKYLCNEKDNPFN